MLHACTSNATRLVGARRTPLRLRLRLRVRLRRLSRRGLPRNVSGVVSLSRRVCHDAPGTWLQRRRVSVASPTQQCTWRHRKRRWCRSERSPAAQHSQRGVHGSASLGPVERTRGTRVTAIQRKPPHMSLSSTRTLSHLCCRRRAEM